MIVGITGGTGCGKTTALRAFEALGGVVLDCDEIYHELLRSDRNLLRAIGERFPGTVKEDLLDRKALGALVFSDRQALMDLNGITHKAVKAKVLERIAAAPGHVAIDAIGLFEGELAELCQETVAVTAPEECRVARLMARDGISAEYAEKRIAAQRPQSEFAQLCRYTLHNDGTEKQFYEKCLAFFKALGIMKP